MRKMKKKKKRVLVLIAMVIIVIIVVVIIACFLLFNKKSEFKMADLSTMTLAEIQEYTKDNDLKLTTKEEYNFDISKGKVISQSIKKNTIIKDNNSLIVVISKGPIPVSVYQDNKVNELGGIPVMMYHSIVNLPSSEVKYTGGNIDIDGFSRTAEAFNKDLEKYYKEDYRMIRLIDYMNGNIDVPLGKSPIILTFDDGYKNNINILGLDDKGNLKIDPNSAVGILESFKDKYPDFNVTATFFLNKSLFGQPEYNEKIMKWLVDHGYDIGNHTKSHVNFNGCDGITAQMEVASMYQMFDSIIPNKYVHIVALPYGSPYKKSHGNFPLILNGSYNGYIYQTEGTLQVGWTYDLSPYHKDFDKTFIMRVRAWDNNGDTDIEMTFNKLKKNRYISDGDKDTIVVTNKDNLSASFGNKRIIKY